MVNHELVTLATIYNMLAKLQLSNENIDRLSKSHLKQLGLAGVSGYQDKLLSDQEYEIYIKSCIHPRELVNVVNDKHNQKITTLTKRREN